MKIIDGKATATEIKSEITKEVAEMIDIGKDAPHLAAVLIGDDPASQTYVSGKEKSCKEVGFISSLYKFPNDITEKELLKVVDFINKDELVEVTPHHIRLGKKLLTYSQRLRILAASRLSMN